MKNTKFLQLFKILLCLFYSYSHKPSSRLLLTKPMPSNMLNAIYASNIQLSFTYLYSNSPWSLQSSLSAEQNLKPLNFDLYLEQVGTWLIAMVHLTKKGSILWSTTFWRHIEKWKDNYFGLMLSLFKIILIITYTFLVIINIQRPPFLSNKQMLWNLIKPLRTDYHFREWLIFL